MRLLVEMGLPIEILAELIRVLKLEGQAILDCALRLQNETQAGQVQKAVNLIHHSLEIGGKIIITGVGKSGKVGQKIAATLSSTGSLSLFLHPTEGLHGDLGVVRSQDAVIAISYTGNTEEIIQLFPSFKNLGVPTIGLGGNSQSRLGKLCDVWIDAWVQQEACPHNLAPTASTTLALAIGDALAVTLMQLRKFQIQDFVVNHPGGSIGKKLTLRVKDLMHRGVDVSVVSPSVKMDEVVNASTQKKLGAVLVAEKTCLIGIITDGDIRRALQFKEKFFQMSADQVMTKNPTVAHPEMLAQVAFELMENRPSQISVLPVVDDAGHWVGLVRLHDLVKTF